MRIFAFIAASFVLQALTGCGRADERPNVLLIIIDTLRADHLGCYGYGRDTSPAIDSLAASGTMWSSVTAQSTWTLPAMATIYTGLSPRSHGAVMTADWLIFGMDPDTPTIATVFHSEGYGTGGFINVYLASEQMNFHHGFARFYCNYIGHGMAGETVDEFLRWREDDGSDAPFLAVMHFFDVHDPYDPPEPFDGLFTEGGARGLTMWTLTEDDEPAFPEERDHLVGLYDGEIRWVDSQLSRVFSWLRESGLDDRTFVVVTSDHGEAFLEREGRGGILHRTMHQEIVHVPLIISGPGIPAGVVDSTPAGQFDILPTLLHLTGIDSSVEMDGLSLVGEAIPQDRPLPIEHFKENQASVVREDRKLMWYFEPDSAFMFELCADPLERRPLPPDSSLLADVLDFWATPCRWSPVLKNIPEVQQLLLDLGYI